MSLGSEGEYTVSTLKRMLEKHGRVVEDDLDGYVIHIFKCKYCGKSFAGTFFDVYNRTRKHLKEAHDIDIREE